MTTGSDNHREQSIIDGYLARRLALGLGPDTDLHPIADYAAHRVAWIREHGGICLCCDSAPADTLDHLTPVKLGGLHRVWNIGYICRSCNSAKADKPLDTWLVGKPSALIAAYGRVMGREAELMHRARVLAPVHAVETALTVRRYRDDMADYFPMRIGRKPVDPVSRPLTAVESHLVDTFTAEELYAGMETLHRICLPDRMDVDVHPTTVIDRVFAPVLADRKAREAEAERIEAERIEAARLAREAAAREAEKKAAFYSARAEVNLRFKAASLATYDQAQAKRKAAALEAERARLTALAAKKTEARLAWAFFTGPSLVAVALFAFNHLFS